MHFSLLSFHLLKWPDLVTVLIHFSALVMSRVLSASIILSAFFWLCLTLLLSAIIFLPCLFCLFSLSFCLVAVLSRLFYIL